MAKVLCMSSYVASGHIGLSAIVPALQGLGHETIALPTVVLSNHPGHSRFFKQDVMPANFSGMADALFQSGWLTGVDAVLTGYMPTASHVTAAAAAIAHVRSANLAAIIMCDPVLGDDPGGLYIAAEAAAAVRDELVPIADVITPNAFELSWLSGLPVSNAADAMAAAVKLACKTTLATSVPMQETSLGNVLINPAGRYVTHVARLPSVPHGTGDFMAALYLGHLLDDHSPHDALRLATAGVEAVLQRSKGRDELMLIPNQDIWQDILLEAIDRDIS